MVINDYTKQFTDDLTGRTFNKLEVIKRVDDHVTESGRKFVLYACLCECGKQCTIPYFKLVCDEDSVGSCGCDPNDDSRYENHMGREFGRWVALYRLEGNRERNGRKITMWRCLCECGTIKDVRAATLKRKKDGSLSCGCYKLEKLTNVLHLEGDVFGRWTVLGIGEDWTSSVGRVYKTWSCQCECGTVRDVIETSLIQNKSLSCGCLRNERIAESATYMDMTGMVFNRWTVISRAPDRFYEGGGRAQMWNCICECGNTNIVAGNMLRSGVSQSCGCISRPVRELHVESFLDDNGYTYEINKMYPDLLGVGNGQLSYDFLVYDDQGNPIYLIECQGEQHYRPVEFFGGVARFEDQVEHDLRKKKYAESIDVPLIEIHYTKRLYDDIEKELLKYFVIPSVFS